jgi:iron(III) transport system substrate-binding protein
MRATPRDLIELVSAGSAALWGLLCAAALAASLSVVAPAPTLAGDEAKPLPVLQELYEKAKAEKEVYIWSSGPDPIAWINAAFSKRFPGIEVKTLADQRATSKLIAESRAGKVTADVFAWSLGGTIEIDKRGLLEKVDWQRYGVQPSDIFFNGNAASYYSYVYAITYPKGKFTEADLPKTWKDLLDPKWKGRLVASDFLMPRIMGYFAMEWGEAEAVKWAQALLKDQNLLVTNAPAINFLRSGERDIIIADGSHAYIGYRQQGMDTASKMLDYVPATQFIVSLVKSAPHPNAAQLLLAWLVSDDGRAAFEEATGVSDIRPGSKSQQLKQISAQGGKPLYETTETMEQRADYYKKFSEMFRGN